jgi:hypothetical protein
LVFVAFANVLFAVSEQFELEEPCFESSFFCSIAKYFAAHTKSKVEFLAFFHFALGGKLNHAFAILRAHSSFYKSISKLSKNRALKKQYHQLKFLKGVYNSSLVFEFYVKSKKLFHQLNHKKFGQ